MKETAPREKNASSKPPHPRVGGDQKATLERTLRLTGRLLRPGTADLDCTREEGKPPELAALLNRSRFTGRPRSAPRDRDWQDFYRRCQEVGADDLLVLSGDNHAFWSNILFDDAGKPMGLELGTAGITSPSLYSLGRVPTSTIGAICIAANSEVQWTDSVHRGYVRILLERHRGRADFVAVDADTHDSYRSNILRRTSFTARTEGKGSVR